MLGMVDDPNKLTEAQQQKAINWLEQHWKGHKICPLCGSNNWTIGAHFQASIVIAPSGDIQLGGTVYPMFSVMSDQCGYTFYVNAVLSGVFERNPEPSNG